MLISVPAYPDNVHLHGPADEVEKAFHRFKLCKNAGLDTAKRIRNVDLLLMSADAQEFLWRLGMKLAD